MHSEQIKQSYGSKNNIAEKFEKREEKNNYESSVWYCEKCASGTV